MFRKTFALILVLALVAGTIFYVACDKENPSMVDLKTPQRIEKYDENSRYLGHSWVDPASGAIMSATWVCDTQQEFHSALCNYSEGDTIELNDDEVDFYWVSTPPYSYCRLTEVVIKPGSASYRPNVYMSDDSCGVNRIVSLSHGARIYGLNLYYDSTAEPYYSNMVFSGWPTDFYRQVIAYQCWFQLAEDGDGWDIEAGSGYSGMPVLFWETGDFGDGGGGLEILDQYSYVAIDGDSRWYDIANNGMDVCDLPITNTYNGTVYWKEWCFKDYSCNHYYYDTETAPTFSNYALDSYDKSCNPTVSVSISFPDDEEDISTVYFDYGCDYVWEASVQATKTSGKWRAKLDIVSEGCLGGDCDFVWRPRVIYCTGDDPETTYFGGTSDHDIQCGICYRK